MEKEIIILGITALVVGLFFKLSIDALIILTVSIYLFHKQMAHD